MLARVFAARGVTATEELDTRSRAISAFASLKGIDAASARLADAIAGREQILVVADYDADGATACAVGVRGLRRWAPAVDFLVPNRFEYGYGLTPEIVARRRRAQPRLIVTVDNGIASHDGVAEAAARGIEVLITDHHLPAATLPAPASDRQSEPAGLRVSEQAPRRRRRDVLRADGDPRAAARARRVRRTRRSPISPRCSISSRSAPSPTSCALDRLNRALVAQGLARIRAGRAQPGVAALFAAAGPRRAPGERPTTSASSPDRGSTPPAASPT